MTRRARIVTSERPTIPDSPAPAPDPASMRMRTNHPIDAGDIMLSTTGRCWRVESVREVNTRAPHPDVAHVYQLSITRYPSEDVARHLDLSRPPATWRVRVGGAEVAVNPTGPWWVDLPGGRVGLHPFVRHPAPNRNRFTGKDPAP